ncbi:MAG TPA: hypothetical protein VJN02_11485 [Gammaproteobacteria bacterium]|nr:hypothetical protein [Gammaproteobacteria bacterium]
MHSNALPTLLIANETPPDAIRSIPENIKSVELLGTITKSTLDVLPRHLIAATITHASKETITNLPEHISRVIFNDEILDDAISAIPKTIKSVKLGGSISKKQLSHLPTHLKKLAVDNTISKEMLKNIPESITNIFISYDFNEEKLSFLPKHITTLTVPHKVNEKVLKKIPESITTLIVPYNFNLDLLNYISVKKIIQYYDGRSCPPPRQPQRQASEQSFLVNNKRLRNEETPVIEKATSNNNAQGEANEVDYLELPPNKLPRSTYAELQEKINTQEEALEKFAQITKKLIQQITSLQQESSQLREEFTRFKTEPFRSPPPALFKRSIPLNQRAPVFSFSGSSNTLSSAVPIPHTSAMTLSFYQINKESSLETIKRISKDFKQVWIKGNTINPIILQHIPNHVDSAILQDTNFEIVKSLPSHITAVGIYITSTSIEGEAVQDQLIKALPQTVNHLLVSHWMNSRQLSCLPIHIKILDFFYYNTSPISEELLKAIPLSVTSIFFPKDFNKNHCNLIPHIPKHLRIHQWTAEGTLVAMKLVPQTQPLSQQSVPKAPGYGYTFIE